MKRNYRTPEVEICNVNVEDCVLTSTSPQPGSSEEIPVTGPTEEIEEVNGYNWSWE